MKPRWNETRAKVWLKDHNYKPIKAAHVRGGEIRYRLMEPNFAHYSTIKTAEGVYFVLGWVGKR